MISLQKHIVQYDACAERVKSTRTYDVASQAFDLVILLYHTIVPWRIIQHAEIQNREVKNKMSTIT